MIYGLIVSNIYYSKKIYQVGEGSDSFLTYGPEVDPRGWAVNQVIAYIKRAIPPKSNFTVVPEGIMINYLVRRENPVKFDNFTPVYLIGFGDVIQKSLVYMAPDFIILVHRESSEYGVGNFGLDPNNGKDIMNWISNSYEPVWGLLSEPFVDHRFGIKILKRKEWSRVDGK